MEKLRYGSLPLSKKVQPITKKLMANTFQNAHMYNYESGKIQTIKTDFHRHAVYQKKKKKKKWSRIAIYLDKGWI